MSYPTLNEVKVEHANHIKELGGACHAEECDVSDPEQLKICGRREMVLCADHRDLIDKAREKYRQHESDVHARIAAEEDVER